MRAAFLTAFGGPDQVEVGEVADPVPGPGEVLVRVRAAGVGPWDLAVAAGAFGPQGGFPLVLGSDVAGEVVGLGPGVDGPAVGTPVMAFRGFSGAWAELEAVPLTALAALPDGVDPVRAAALPVCASTAHQAVVDGLDAAPGRSLVVLGAGGVVGGFAVQFGVGRGARVLGTAGPRDHERLTALGADAVFDYHGDWVGEVQARLPDGADAVLDLVGGPVTEQAFAVLADGGRLVTTVLGNPDLVAPRGISWSFQGTQAEPDRLARIGELVATGGLEVEIGARFPLADAGRAMQAVASRSGSGKVIIDVG